MKKRIQSLKVVQNLRLNPSYFILRLQSSTDLPDMLPGQFAEVLVEGNPRVFLRRPVSVHDVDAENRILSLLIRIVGEGTRSLALLQNDSLLNLVYPLGNSFNLKGVRKVLVAGGGCGIAPMLYLTRCLSHQGIETDILLGARTASEIFEKELFASFGRVHISTDDGSQGHKGFITENPVLHELAGFDRLYTCGPEVMMKVFARLAAKAGTDCEVSLENTMACGIGACLCCVTETTGGHKCVCTEGPVFNTKDLTWQI